MSWKPEDGTIRSPETQAMLHDVRVQIDARDSERARERTRLRPLLERCEAMLGRVQWSCDDGFSVCPECGLDEPEHAPACHVAALLADLRKELGK